MIQERSGQTEGVNPLVAGSPRASSLLEPQFWVDRGLVFGKMRRLLGVMARRIRIQFPGARYHIINRGNYRHDVFTSEGARQAFIRTLGEAAAQSRRVGLGRSSNLAGSERIQGGGRPDRIEQRLARLPQMPRGPGEQSRG